MRTLIALALLVTAAACKPGPLSDVEVASQNGAVRVRTPAGPGWNCQANDEVKETFTHHGVKCVLAKGLVLTAKVYEVQMADVRTAEIFCIQDWKQAYAALFTGVIVKASDEVKDFRGTPACEVVLEGTTQKGPWRLWEIHAPNGRKLLNVSVSGSLPVVTEQQASIDAWLQDLRYDLRVPGQQ
jgi:hypothetical protein